MDTANDSLARNLRRLRSARGVSLASIAERAGLSKATLSEIERGIANPSVDTVWALAAALDVPFASMFANESGDVLVKRRADLEVVSIDDGFEGRLVFQRAFVKPIEVYQIDLEAGAVRQALGHASGVTEHLVIIRGGVAITTAGETHRLSTGDYIAFPADTAHEYRAVDGAASLIALHEYS